MGPWPTWAWARALLLWLCQRAKQDRCQGSCLSYTPKHPPESPHPSALRLQGQVFSWGSPTCSQPLPEQRSVGLQEQVLKKPVRTDKTSPVHVTSPCHQPPRVGFQWCQQLAAGSGQQGGGCRSQRCAAQCPAPAPPGHKPGTRVRVRWGWVSASWNHFLEATDEVTKCPVWGYACPQRRGLWQSGLAAGGGSRPRPLGQGSAEAVPEHLLPPAWPGGSSAAVCSPLGRLTLDWRGPLPPPSPSPSPRLAGSIHSAPPYRTPVPPQQHCGSRIQVRVEGQVLSETPAFAQAVCGWGIVMGSRETEAEQGWVPLPHSLLEV